MKYVYVILALLVASLVTAAPKLKDLKPRNVYMKPLHEIKAPTSPRIIGGHEVVPHSIPYQAFLEVFNDTMYWECGGSVLSENYVMTAGHCCDAAVEAYITLGAHKPMTLEDTQLNVVSKEIILHEDFYHSIQYLINDICVMKFPDPIGFNEYIQPVALPSWADVENLYEGSVARISGWGLVDGDDTQISDVLNAVNVTVIGNRLCETTFGVLFPSIMCTSGMMNTGSCSGDSGGPLVVDEVQVGIVSFGAAFCAPGYPSAFTRLTRFLDWIEDHTDVKIK